MASLIATRNRSILNPNDQVYGCNYRVKNDCPLQHKYLTPGIVYQENGTNNNDLYVKLLLRKGTGVMPVLLDMRNTEMKRNFRITSGH